MIPWELLDSAPVPGSRKGELSLHRRGTDYEIRIDREELMTSRLHGSEEALARIGCERIAARPNARVLIGGLGMGFTTAAALVELGRDAEIVVAELAPAVIRWNRGPLADLAGRPLDDPRVRVFEGDVGDAIRGAEGGFDAILLDVDNGPEGFTRKANDWLYGRAGLAATFAALRPGGIYGVWSATSDAKFAAKLRSASFTVDDLRVPARPGHGGRHHTVWIATRG